MRRKGCLFFYVNEKERKKEQPYFEVLRKKMRKYKTEKGNRSVEIKETGNIEVP